LKTVKIEDLDFTAPFELEATRQDYVHAFLGWFDTHFNACHKRISFSTGPHAKVSGDGSPDDMDWFGLAYCGCFR